MTREPTERSWEIAVDMTPRKVNGDRLTRRHQPLERAWYVEHPEAWELVEVVPVAEVERLRTIIADLCNPQPGCWQAALRAGRAEVDRTRPDEDDVCLEHERPTMPYEVP